MGWLSSARANFHADVLNQILTVSQSGVPSNADKGSGPSVAIAQGIVRKIGSSRTAQKLAGQTAGANFEDICASFVRATFDRLRHLRPGKFTVEKGGKIARFDQYSHLDELEELSRNHRELATALGADYLIKPDVVIFRTPEEDSQINATDSLVDNTTAKLTPLRMGNSGMEILHASISCKWTLRSDRAQNARSEALNLVRNRKGSLPHIVAVTGEPTPGRIASLALGTGDIDCVYHFALPELRQTLIEQKRDDALELLEMMIQGKRLRDISDLPLDLTV